MATEYPAQLAGLGDKIGTLAAGHYADLLVLKNVESDPYESVVHAKPSDVELVVVGGRPLYGSPEMMQKLLFGETLEALKVCGTPKAIDFGVEGKMRGTTPQSWKQTTSDLRSALGEWGSRLAPLADCQSD